MITNLLRKINKNKQGQLQCEKCREYSDDVKMLPDIWSNEHQQYVECFICNSCLEKWQKRENDAERR